MNFIPGVTLLNVQMVPRNIPIVVTIFVGLLTTILIWIFGDIFPKWYQRLICRTSLLIIVWASLICQFLYPTYWIRYDVTIDNNVSYVEFTDIYGTNISRDGEIYSIIGETHRDWVWNMKEYENEELGKLSER